MWIDAICINQNDHDEQGIQVAKMREIYSQAEKVHVLLGEIIPEDLQWFYDFRQLPMRAVALMDQEAPEKKRIFETISSREWNETAFSKSNKFLEDILQRPYFSRVWILQELSCAKVAEVLFANAAGMEWPQFMQYLMASDASRKVYGSSITAELPKVMRLQGETDPRKLGLLRLLLETRQADATDIKDKVYALLGIAADAAIVSVPISYAIPSAAVFTTTAQRLIESSRSLEVLSAVCESSAMEDLPSWVPDFSLKPQRSNITRNARSGDNAGSAACSGLQFSGSFLTTEETLFLRCNGKLIGKVLSPSTPYQSPQNPTAWPQWAMMTHSLTFMRALRGHTGSQQLLTMTLSQKLWKDNMLDTLARTMVAYRADDMHGPCAYPLPKAQSSDHDTFFLHPEYEFIKWQQGKTVPEWTWYQQFVEHHCKGRRLAIMTSVDLALVPQHAIAGDFLYVLEGLSVSIILRSVKEDKYKVIGESYCHRIMDGQVLEDPEIAPLVGDWEEICLE